MSTSKILKEIESKYIRNDLPVFRPGDTIRVHAKIREGGKERIQIIEGVVLCKTGSGSSRTFTIRKISGGIGVEIIYPLASNRVTKVEIVSHGDVRRSRLYYLRGLSGKAARLKSKDTVGSDPNAASENQTLLQ